MTDNRRNPRDCLFLLADMRVRGEAGEHRIRVRNLSAAGMMGEGHLLIERGSAVEICLRHIGWIAGSVAWVQGGRFGVAFVAPIDPKLARDPVKDGEHMPRQLRPPLSTSGCEGSMRKV